jgi:hypothetical protein
MLLTLLLDPAYHYGEQYELAADTAFGISIIASPLVPAILVLRWSVRKLRRSVSPSRMWCLVVGLSSLVSAGYLFWLVSICFGLFLDD